jgi:hypothetical protein
MKKTIVSAALSVCIHFSFAQIIPVTPKQLPNLQLEGSTMNIQVVVIDAVPQLYDTVVASVSGRSTRLIFSSIVGRFLGSLNLLGLPEDTLTLQITAHDTAGNYQSDSVKFIYDLPPTLTVDSPVSMSVARPGIRIKAKCMDSDGCTLSVGRIGDIPEVPVPFFSTTASSVDTAIDLSAYQGGSGSLVITAVDGKGQTIAVYRQVFIESSPYLNQAFSASDEIFDLSNNKILVSNPPPNSSNIADLNPYVHRSRIVNILTGDSVVIPYAGPLYPTNSQITPYGAIICPFDTATYLPSLADWNNDSLYVLATETGVGERVVGNKAVWVNDSILYLRDLVSASNTRIAVAYDLALGPNNVIAYASKDYNIYRWSNGTATLITSNAGGKWNTGPVTDGRYIAYIKTDPCCNFGVGEIHLNTGVSDTLLSALTLGSDLPNSRDVYQVSNTFTSYAKPDTAGHLQIWLRDSTGLNTQETIFANTGRIELLNPNGDFTFLRGTPQNGIIRCFLRRSTGQVCEIGSSLGQVFYEDTSWHIAIGRMLYTIDLSSIPNAVMGASIPVDSSVYPFAASDFIRNFTGYAPLAKVMINRLPEKGLLQLKGVNVTGGQQIPVDSLNRLTYTPNAGVTGIDSLIWNGSNGNTYTPSSATVILNIGIAKPLRPVISGLASGYCRTRGSQKIKILNLPDTAAGNSVQAFVDSSSLTLAQDSSITVNISGLNPGMHLLELVYTNAGGSNLLADSFLVVGADTPRVRASSNISTVVNLVDPVVIMAIDAGGGGSSPLYTFASDRAITTILQAEGPSNLMTITPGNLTIGNNWIYARMRTSDTCTIAQTAIDSVLVTRSTVTGIVDPEFPSQEIDVFPNPFTQTIRIEGLNNEKAYLFVMHNAIGGMVYRQETENRGSFIAVVSALPAGSYWLSVYDRKKNKLIGTMPVVKK